jgi:hypothetical protein
MHPSHRGAGADAVRVRVFRPTVDPLAVPQWNAYIALESHLSVIYWGNNAITPSRIQVRIHDGVKPGGHLIFDTSNLDNYLVSGSVVGTTLRLVMADGTIRNVALPSGADAIKGLLALAIGANYPTAINNDTDAATPLFVKKAIAAAIAALPGDKFLQGLQSYNSATDVMTLLMNDGTTVAVDMTALVNDSVATALAAMVDEYVNTMTYTASSKVITIGRAIGANLSVTLPDWSTTVDGLVMKASDVETTQDADLGLGNDFSIAAPVGLLDDTKGVTSRDVIQLVDKNYYINSNMVFDVGVDARFPTIKSVFDFLRFKSINKGNVVSINLPAGTLSELSLGVPHPDSDRIRVYGAPMTGAFPTRAQLAFTGMTAAQRTAAKTANKALMRSRWATKVVCPAIAWQNDTGYGQWHNVLFEGYLRFTSYNVYTIHQSIGVIGPATSTMAGFSFCKGITFNDSIWLHDAGAGDDIATSLIASTVIFTGAVFMDCDGYGVSAKFSQVQFNANDYVAIVGYRQFGFTTNQGSNVMLYGSCVNEIRGNGGAYSGQNNCSLWTSAAGVSGSLLMENYETTGYVMNFSGMSHWGPRTDQVLYPITVKGGGAGLIMQPGCSAFLDNVTFDGQTSHHVYVDGAKVECFATNGISFLNSPAVPIYCHQGGHVALAGSAVPPGCSPAVGVIGNANSMIAA